MKYRKIPVEINAWQWQGGILSDLVQEGNPPAYIHKAILDKSLSSYIEGSSGERKVGINTLEGQISASKGDYIIQGVKGELYPCKPDIFEMTYESA